ncbi:hypothetical protein [Pseudofrankia sp. BMG5.37]|uniref:hypothetical protein n=1 Tax=Pseudofrankia sp. BMG5.37 TaxID=3050035 RepID=UPI0028952FCA|nr:hypothetical protein [Pseudofrankia sp. BMG5.37]MDT3440143.1 hypothetical protein [Pseudofrankia sp. BMG5.37]
MDHRRQESARNEQNTTDTRSPVGSLRWRLAWRSGGLAVTAAAIAALAACNPADTSAGSSWASPSQSPAAGQVPASPQAGTRDTDSAATYARQFRDQFPDLAQGKTDAQIVSDGEADCADMAANRQVTTPTMAQRYGLSDSLADKFTLNNIGLLAMFTICPVR